MKEQPPSPPKFPTARIVTAAAVILVSSQIGQSPLVVVSPPLILKVEAQFAPTTWTNLQAFFDVRTNANASWTRLATLAYPTNGGWMSACYTDQVWQAYFRAGIALPQ